MEDKKIPITVNLPVSIYEKISKRAKKDERSFSFVVRNYLEKGMEREVKA